MEVLLSLICTISFFACIWFLISAIIKRAKAGREGVSKEEASREPIKKALISIGVSILSFILFFVFVPSPEQEAKDPPAVSSEAQQEAPPIVEQPAAESESAPATASDADVEAAYISLAESFIKEGFTEDQYSVEQTEDTIIFSTWIDGLALTASAIVQGYADTGVKDNWASMRDNAQAAAKALSDIADQSGVKKHIQLNLLNDQDHGHMLMSFVDGVCWYDVTNQ